MHRHRRNESDHVALSQVTVLSTYNSKHETRAFENPRKTHPYDRPRKRPTQVYEHRDKLTLNHRLRNHPLVRMTRWIRHVALKNVPYRRKVACCSQKPPGKLHPTRRNSIAQRSLNRGWTTEGTQSAPVRIYQKFKCAHTSNSRLINILVEP